MLTVTFLNVKLSIVIPGVVVKNVTVSMEQCVLKIIKITRIS
jgi:hypothetical protein